MPTVTTGSFATSQADNFLRRVNIQIGRAIKSQGVEQMHDLRVAIRRFNRILSALERCFPRAESKRMRRGLKRIMVQAGDVRNYDIAMHLIARIGLPQSGTLMRQFQIRRDLAATVLAPSLHRWTARNLTAAWHAALKADRASRSADVAFRAAPVEVTAKRILPDMVAEHFHRGEAAADGKASAHKIHRFRIAAKNFRYTLDFFAPLVPDRLSTLTDRLKDIQNLLGDINDCAATRRIVKEEITAEGDKAVRRDILSEVKKRQRKKTLEFREQFAAEFSSGSALRQWQDSVRSVAPPKSVPTRSSASRQSRPGSHKS